MPLERETAATALKGDDLLLLRGEAAVAAGASSSSASSPLAACAARCSINSLRFAAAARDALIAFCLRLSRSMAAGLLISAVRAFTSHGPPSKFQTTRSAPVMDADVKQGWSGGWLPVDDTKCALVQWQSAIVPMSSVASVQSAQLSQPPAAVRSAAPFG
jgi:hypothetical protein